MCGHNDQVNDTSELGLLGLDEMLGFGRKRHTHDCYPLWISDYYDLKEPEL
jgi:hypothetical protein